MIANNADYLQGTSSSRRVPSDSSFAVSERIPRKISHQNCDPIHIPLEVSAQGNWAYSSAVYEVCLFALSYTSVRSRLPVLTILPL